MASIIQPGFMVFLKEGSEGIGAVRKFENGELTIYVENRGEFMVSRSAIVAVHDGKVLLDVNKLDRSIVNAVGHAHDSEDPDLVG
jgi:hypothetical protein